MNNPHSNIKGYLSIVLHAHLPFVRHPESDFMLEENWLYEAITETYIPLLNIFEDLAENRVPFRVTMSLTPPLCSMLSDKFLQERYTEHIERLIQLAEKEVERTVYDAALNNSAKMYLDKFNLCRTIFVDKNNGNLVNAFKSLQDRGYLEIITCGATHGFLPNMQYNENAVRAQIVVAKQSYREYFDRDPVGIWLPECGYFPGVEKFLENAGIRYFFTDTHGILFAHPRPKYGSFAPVYCKGTHVAAFGRDVESSRSVWSSKVGYPGDPDYRDFYKDIGFDLDYDYIAPYIDPIGQRMHTGIKYYRVTGDTEDKQPYSQLNALNKAFDHAGNFLFNRQKQADHLNSLMDRKPIIVAPYDAELLGHWWYEGPNWLNFLIRKTAFEQNDIKMITPSDYLAEYPTNQLCTPSFSSWGEDGYSSVWLESSNDWIYRHIHINEERMVEVAQKNTNPTEIERRVLNQMARELLLSESSDWAFIMKTGTMVDYAVRRTKEHIANFQKLYDDLNDGKISKGYLELLESHSNIFPNIDYRVYA